MLKKNSNETFCVIFKHYEEEETGEIQIENLHPFFFDKVYLLDDRNKRPEHSGPGRVGLLTIHTRQNN